MVVMFLIVWWCCNNSLCDFHVKEIVHNNGQFEVTHMNDLARVLSQDLTRVGVGDIVASVRIHTIDLLCGITYNAMDIPSTYHRINHSDFVQPRGQATHSLPYGYIQCDQNLLCHTLEWPSS